MSIGDRNNISRVNRSFQLDMGGREGWEAWKVEKAAAVAACRWIAEIDRKRAARELRAKQRRKDRLRLAVRVIDYRLNIGRVSIKTVAWRQNVYPIRLKRLYNRLQEEHFFQQPGWEEHVLSCSEFSASTYSSHDSNLDGDGDGEEVQQPVG